MIITIKEAHQWASSLLKQHSIEHATLEAEVLIRSLYNWDRSKFFLHLHEQISMGNWEQLENWLNRRIQHEPLQYIVGNQEFYGRKFNVNPNVLIPRPETELLVETVLRESTQLSAEHPINIVDIGAGSGAIAVTLALEKEDWNVHAVDISEKALLKAIDNANDLQAKVTFHQGNILSPLIDKEVKVDIIVSNPPYIPKTDILTLMSEVKDYEPLLALDGGEDGLDFYREILNQSKQVLQKPGIIAFEIGINQSDEIAELFSISGADKIKVIPDFQGIPRIVIGWYYF